MFGTPERTEDFIPSFSSEGQRVVEFSLLSQTESWSRVGEVEGGGAGDGQEERRDEQEVHLSPLGLERLESERTDYELCRTELSRGTTLLLTTTITVTLGGNTMSTMSIYNII